MCNFDIVERDFYWCIMFINCLCIAQCLPIFPSKWFFNNLLNNSRTLRLHSMGNETLCCRFWKAEKWVFIMKSPSNIKPSQKYCYKGSSQISERCDVFLNTNAHFRDLANSKDVIGQRKEARFLVGCNNVAVGYRQNTADVRIVQAV